MRVGEDVQLLALNLGSDWTIHVVAHAVIFTILVVIAFGFVVWRFLVRKAGPEFEIEQTEIGVGNGKITFKPNWTDRQVAYSIWVELSTRKIGLPIDFEHDVVAEVLDSWYSFFGITRELIKTVPVQKVRNPSTEKIIRLSIDVLNEGLRPTLTKWQARFRRWYERELNREGSSPSPQEIQQNFPQWHDLVADMTQVNIKLINYRRKLHALVMSK